MSVKDDGIIGKTFGKLTVIEFSHTVKYNSPSHKNSCRVFKCLCQCGNYHTVLRINLMNGHVKSCGCLTQYKSLNDAIDRNTRWNGDCFEWTGSLGNGGYGRFDFNKKRYRAHRVVYELKYGTIPKDKIIRHLCHNPKCCNPKHLALGTQKDNMQDMVKAKRSLIGENHPGVKLKECDVLEIRCNRDGLTHRKFAEIYGVCKATITQILQRKIWKHLPEEVICQ